MSANEKVPLDLTVMLVTDEETGLISATCAQFPEAMAQGHTGRGKTMWLEKFN